MQMFCYSAQPEIKNKLSADEAWRLGSGWVSKESDLNGLRDWVLGGHAFVCAAMYSGTRTSAGFKHADFIGVDIDHGLSIDQFRKHSLSAQSCWGYTTCSHDPTNGAHRYRIIFKLPERIHDSGLYTALYRTLQKSLGADPSCKDPCRAYYGNSAAEDVVPLSDATLDPIFIVNARTEQRRAEAQFNARSCDFDEFDIAKAEFILQNLDTHQDRDRFLKISNACSSVGDRLFSAWSDWASQTHHGQDENSHRVGDNKWFRPLGEKGVTLASLFHIADKEIPSWRNDLPDEIKELNDSTGFRVITHNAAGMDHSDFLGDDDYYDSPVEVEAAKQTVSLLSAQAGKLLQRPGPQIQEPEEEPINTDPDFEGNDLPPDDASSRSSGGGKIRILSGLILNTYPGLRLNEMSLAIEFGAASSPQVIEDLGSVYIQVGRNSGGQILDKNLTKDLTKQLASDNRYNPARKYVTKCMASVPPCQYFDRLASTLIGVEEDDRVNPLMPDGQRYADVVLKRFFIGAAARLFRPGIRHDWMPVFIGSQNCGKSSFFSYITPPDYTDDEMYPWATTVQQSIEYLKDRPHALHQGWIVLMDEFERYSKRKYCEELKNLVSVSVDNSARKYENERRFPRSFVLAGATNSRDFLVDPTGNRRFMPILVNGVVAARENPDLRIIDLDRLKLDRDSIWSAAYKAFLDGEPHVFSSYEISCIDETINSFTRDTPVYGAVVEALNRGLRRSDSTSLLRTTRGKRARQCIVLNSLFEEMHVPVDRHSNMNIPVTDVLKQLGFKDDRGILENDSSGRQVRVWILPRNFMKRRLTDDMPFS